MEESEALKIPHILYETMENLKVSIGYIKRSLNFLKPNPTKENELRLLLRRISSIASKQNISNKRATRASASSARLHEDDLSESDESIINRKEPFSKKFQSDCQKTKNCIQKSRKLQRSNSTTIFLDESSGDDCVQKLIESGRSKGFKTVSCEDSNFRGVNNSTSKLFSIVDSIENSFEKHTEGKDYISKPEQRKRAVSTDSSKDGVNDAEYNIQHSKKPKSLLLNVSNDKLNNTNNDVLKPRKRGRPRGRPTKKRGRSGFGLPKKYQRVDYNDKLEPGNGLLIREDLIFNNESEYVCPVVDQNVEEKNQLNGNNIGAMSNESQTKVQGKNSIQDQSTVNGKLNVASKNEISLEIKVISHKKPLKEMEFPHEESDSFQQVHNGAHMNSTFVNKNFICNKMHESTNIVCDQAILENDIEKSSKLAVVLNDVLNGCITKYSLNGSSTENLLNDPTTEEVRNNSGKIHDSSKENAVNDPSTENILNNSTENVENDPNAGSDTENLLNDSKTDNSPNDSTTECAINESNTETVINDTNTETIINESNTETVINESNTETVINECDTDVLNDSNTETSFDSKTENALNNSETDNVFNESNTENVSNYSNIETVQNDSVAENVCNDCNTGNILSNTDAEIVLKDFNMENIVYHSNTVNVLNLPKTGRAQNDSNTKNETECNTENIQNVSNTENKLNHSDTENVFNESNIENVPNVNVCEELPKSSKPGILGCVYEDISDDSQELQDTSLEIANLTSGTNINIRNTYNVISFLGGSYNVVHSPEIFNENKSSSISEKSSCVCEEEIINHAMISDISDYDSNEESCGQNGLDQMRVPFYGEECYGQKESMIFIPLRDSHSEEFCDTNKTFASTSMRDVGSNEYRSSQQNELENLNSLRNFHDQRLKPMDHTINSLPSNSSPQNVNILNFNHEDILMESESSEDVQLLDILDEPEALDDDAPLFTRSFDASLAKFFDLTKKDT